MARKVFFSFEYKNDLSRAMIVRDSWINHNREAAGFVEKSSFARMKKKGDEVVRKWIDDQLEGTSVTVVLVGEDTHNDRWVMYAIKKSIEIGNGMIGVNITQIRNLRGKTTAGCGRMPIGYHFYLWNRDNGPEKMDDWIEKAAEEKGR